MRRGQQHDSQDQSEPVDSKGISEVKPCFLDTEPDIYPMRCPGTQCLFYLGDVSLAANIRTWCFKNPFTLTQHVDKQQASGVSTACPSNLSVHHFSPITFPPHAIVFLESLFFLYSRDVRRHAA